MIHQQRAHERICFERLMASLENKNIPSQQLLFPQNISFSASDFQVVQSLMPQLREMGFDIDEFGTHEVVVNGIPLTLESNDIQVVLDQLIENEKDFRGNEKEDHLQKMAQILAKVSAIKIGKKMEQEEMHHLVDELFACSSPYVSLNGKPVIINLNLEDIDKSFN